MTIDVECHFDESGTHQESPVVCMAGYIIGKPELEAFEEKWNAVLNWGELEHPLRYFHMVDCAHGNGAFAGISKPNCIGVEKRLIDIIKQHTIQGIAIVVDQAEFYAAMGDHHPLYPEPYILLAHGLLQGLTQWIKANDENTGRIAYFFEDREESRNFADTLIKLLARNSLFGSDYRYAGHGFLPKIGKAVSGANRLCRPTSRSLRAENGKQEQRVSKVSKATLHRSVILQRSPFLALFTSAHWTGVLRSPGTINAQNASSAAG